MGSMKKMTTTKLLKKHKLYKLKKPNKLFVSSTEFLFIIDIFW